MTLTATVSTTSGSRYLQQLCKHWSRMEATAQALVVTLEPNPDADVERFKQVVADHLDRFAFREAPLPFEWQ